MKMVSFFLIFSAFPFKKKMHLLPALCRLSVRWQINSRNFTRRKLQIVLNEKRNVEKATWQI